MKTRFTVIVTYEVNIWVLKKNLHVGDANLEIRFITSILGITKQRRHDGRETLSLSLEK